MHRFLYAAVVVVFAITPFIRADVRTLVDDQTVVAGEVDLSNVDAAAIETWARQTATAAKLFDGAEPPIDPKQFDAIATETARWLTDVRKAGGTEIDLVGNAEALRDSDFAILIRSAPGGDVKALASLLFSGHADGPTTQPADRVPRGARYIRHCEVVNGNLAVVGTDNAIRYVRNLHAKTNADVEAALASAGDAPAKIVLVLTPQLRAQMAPAPPALTALKYAVASASFPPKPSIRVVLQAPSAPAAQSANAVINMFLFKAMQQPDAAAMVQLLTPRLDGDKIVLDLDDSKLTPLAGAMALPLERARHAALAVKSMSNMRQILMGCVMYANVNKGAWPADLNGINKYVAGSGLAEVLHNPARPTESPAYVYLPPGPGPLHEPSKVVVLYEAHKDFTPGVGVGFADGHVEMVTDPQTFDQLIANTALQAAPQ